MTPASPQIPIYSPMSHSLSDPTFLSPTFHNSTYSYPFPQASCTANNTAANLEEMIKLVNRNSSVQQLLVNSSDTNNKSIAKKMNNSDLIDLGDASDKDKENDVLVLFDPLMDNVPKVSDDLNFSNNFTDIPDDVDKVEDSPVVLVCINNNTNTVEPP